MLPFNRLIGSSATTISDNGDVEVDVGNILRRLLLFDTYILKTIRLKEFPEIVRRLGFEATLHLLSSDAFKIHCDALSTGQTGQATVLKSREEKGALPKGSYCFQSVSVPDRRDYISGCFQESIAPMPLSIKQQKKLKHAILDSLEKPPENIGQETIAQLKNDLRIGSPALKLGVVKELKKQFNITTTTPEVKVRLHPIDDDDFRSESNLMNLFSIDLDQNHKIIERAALDLAGLNQKVAEMKSFKAVSGFRVNDLPIFENKIDFLVNSIDPDKQERRSQRVCEIANLPDFQEVGIDYQINMDSFFKVRESSECREFRNWLHLIDNKSDKDIKDQINNLRARIATIANTKTAKSLRFMVSNALGLIPGHGVVLGPLLGVLDTFLLEKVLPKSGVTTFISSLYPSLFDGKALNKSVQMKSNQR